MTSFVSFRTDPDASKRLKMSAAGRGLTLQDLMQELVAEHLASEKRRRAPELAEVISALRTHRSALAARGLTRMSIFGSTARGDARPDSDVDILIEISPETRMSLTAFARLRGELEELLGRPVDLVEWRMLEPSLEVSAERDAVKVF